MVWTVGWVDCVAVLVPYPIPREVLEVHNRRQLDMSVDVHLGQSWFRTFVCTANPVQVVRLGTFSFDGVRP